MTLIIETLNQFEELIKPGDLLLTNKLIWDQGMKTYQQKYAHKDSKSLESHLQLIGISIFKCLLYDKQIAWRSFTNNHDHDDEHKDVTLLFINVDNLYPPKELMLVNNENNYRIIPNVNNAVLNTEINTTVLGIYKTRINFLHGTKEYFLNLDCYSILKSKEPTIFDHIKFFAYPLFFEKV